MYSPESENSTKNVAALLTVKGLCLLLLLSAKKADGQEHGSFGCADGFRAWKKLNPRVYEHERSRRHRAAFIQWKELEQHLHQNTIIDAGLQAQITAERQRWRDVLDRILHTVKLCATQNLPLRGHRESLQQSENPGNFLAVLKLIARYDTLAQGRSQAWAWGLKPPQT